MSNPPRKPRRKGLPILIACLGLLLLGGAATGYALRYGSIVREPFTLLLPAGTPFDALNDSLRGRITSPGRFRLLARVLQLDRRTFSGRYEIARGTSAYRLAATLRGRAQSPVNIAFNNIRTLPQLAGTLGRQLQADSTAFAAVLLNDSIASAYGFSPQAFIGMFIPNTYEVYWTVSPEEFVARMHREYLRFWNDERLGKLARTGLSQQEVATLASIIDEETRRTDEMPDIAGVYINRLRRGMLLQADPTVKYAVGDFSLRRILYRHLATPSPYNTYRYLGLPPGPIRMPSIAAMDAVLNYRQHDYYYFCARADFSGYHAFARTLAEHNRNARAYAAALDRFGIR